MISALKSHKESGRTPEKKGKIKKFQEIIYVF